MPSNEDKYRLIQKQYRKKFLLLQKQLEKEYADISSKLMGKVQKLAFDFADKDGLFKNSDMDQINLEVSAINYWFANEMKDWLDNNITKSADIAIQGQDNAAEYFVKSLIQESAGQDKALLTKALSDGGSGILLRTRYGTGLAKSIRDAVWKKRWNDGFKLSDRVWKMNQLMNDNVKHMVEDCVNQGKSAVNFAKAVEQYLEKPGPAWTTGIKPSITGRGSVKFNALRIARTETNQAYQKAQNLSDKNSVIVKGTKWNLSSSHPTVWPPSAAYNGYPEICDYRAKHNHHGLGPGVFPPGKAPSDHPNGLCYLTSELYQGEELVNRIKEKYKNTKTKFKNDKKSGIIKIGTKVSEHEVVIKNPYQKIIEISNHAKEKLKERNLSLELAQYYVDNSIAAIEQKRTGTIKYVSEVGITVLNKEGKLVTVYQKKFFDDETKKLLRLLKGDKNE